MNVTSAQNSQWNNIYTIQQLAKTVKNSLHLSPRHPIQILVHLLDHELHLPPERLLVPPHNPPKL